MLLNVIHLEHRIDREILLQKELASQNILSCQVWNGIIDAKIPARGIAKAHKQIVSWAKSNKMSEVLICEDDIRFTSTGAFEYYMKNKPVAYDIYLASIYEGDIKQDNTVDDFSGITMYVIHEKFYDIFLSLPENINIDRALSYKGKFIVSNPFVAIQHNGYSDNLKRHCNYDECLKGRSFFIDIKN